MQKCSKCKEEKNFTEFYKNSSRKNGINDYCKKCNTLWGRERYLRNKTYYNNKNKEVRTRNQKFMIDFLEQNPCVDCGEKDIIVLDFDHLSNKENTISIMVSNGYSVESIKKEMNKCVVRCANCHRRKTTKEHGYYKYLGNSVAE